MTIDSTWAIAIVGAVIKVPRMCPHRGVRMHYRSRLYPSILCSISQEYRWACATHNYTKMATEMVNLTRDMAELAYYGLLYQCYITRPVHAFYTAIPMKYKHWYDCSVQRFVYDITTVINSKG